MKTDMKKTATKIILTAILILSAILLSSCSPNYKEYRVDKNIMGTVEVDGHSFTAYFFLLPEGSAVMELCDNNKDKKVACTIDFPESCDYYASLDFDFAFYKAAFQDMNFDGHADLYVPCSTTTENLEGMAWLWNSEKDEFILSEELSALYELTVFPDEELITSQDYSSPDGILCKEFKWENGKLVQTGEYTINN